MNDNIYYDRLQSIVDILNRDMYYIDRFKNRVFIDVDFVCFCLVDETYLCAHIENDFEILFPLSLYNDSVVESNIMIDIGLSKYIRSIDIEIFDVSIYKED